MTSIVNREQADAWDGAEGAHWADHAERYNASVSSYDAPLFAAAGIESGDLVLDVGCGCGFTTRDAARIAKDGAAHGVDLSSPMLRVAEALAAAENVANVSFARADAQVEPFDAGSIDVVMSRFGAMFFNDIGAAFGNLGRALRAGGRLAVVGWTDLPRNEWLTVLRETLAAGRELPEPPVGAPGPFGLGDPDRTRAWLEGAGFGGVEINEHRGAFHVGSDTDDAFAFISTTAPVRGLLEPLDDAARTEARDRLRTALARHEAGGAVDLGSSAWVIMATKR
jgi:SAM-dependent methyltransferase